MAAGFREHASGLFVPEEHSRARQVWSWADWRTLDKATKLANERGLSVFLECRDSACTDKKIERIRANDGSIILRCGHADRALMRAF